MKIASEMFHARKKGNSSECSPTNLPENKEKYCDKYFNDDIHNNRDCKDPDEFCFMCCENEFGQLWGKERDNCFAMCDDNKPKGNWVWVPHGNQINNNKSQ